MELKQSSYFNKLHQRLLETHGKHGKIQTDIQGTNAPSQVNAKDQIFHTDGLQININNLYYREFCVNKPNRSWSIFIIYMARMTHLSSQELLGLFKQNSRQYKLLIFIWRPSV